MSAVRELTGAPKSVIMQLEPMHVVVTPAIDSVKMESLAMVNTVTYCSISLNNNCFYRH